MILFKGGAGEPYDIQLPGKAGGAVAVRRTLVSTICWITDPTQVPRPRQLRDASTVMRLRPAHQSVINRRHDDRASCLARQNPEQALGRKPRTRLPDTWNGGHESGANQTFGTHVRWRIAPNSGRSHAHQRASGFDPRSKSSRAIGTKAGWATQVPSWPSPTSPSELPPVLTGHPVLPLIFFNG